jgi:hypothetical protein
MAEVPFDYGVEIDKPQTIARIGAIELKDQGGAKGFQDGFGVNMRGDLAVISNIYYAPKFEESSVENFINKLGCVGAALVVRDIKERQKKNEEVYFVKRFPGRRLIGGTVWIFDSNGELRHEDHVPGLGLVNGAQIDETGATYLVFNSPKLVGGKTFLAGRSAVIGEPETKPPEPFIGTLVKFPPTGGKVLTKSAPIPLDPPPARPPDVAGSGYNFLVPDGWVEGAEWLYAGASPITPDCSCQCPQMRHATDWFKRSFVPEAYRHSVGIVDTAGNLILHVGRYGNADSGRGPASLVRVGSDEIAFAHVQFVSASDDYLCLTDTGNERIVVLKLAYQAEETAGIGGQ